MLIAEAVTIVFLLLKWSSIVSWSWLWIFSPMIIVYGSIVGLFTIIVIAFAAVMVIIKIMDVYHDYSVKNMKKSNTK